MLHFVVPLIALVTLRRRGIGVPPFKTPVPRLVLPLALLCCMVLLVASGPIGAVAGVAWLCVGLLGLQLARTKPLAPHGDPAVSNPTSNR